jgi:general stress protein 26
MNNPSKEAEHEKIWELIKGSHSALLITVKPDGALDSRPMGCLQTNFDGILWFLTFRHSLKLAEVRNNPNVMVAYAKPNEFEYVSISGKARIVEDSQKLNELWTEGLRVWFPNGPKDTRNCNPCGRCRAGNVLDRCCFDDNVRVGLCEGLLDW